MQKKTTAIAPKRELCADSAAKVLSCSRARKTDIGPEVSGKPTSKPLTTGPQRLAVRVTMAIISGVRVSFKKKKNMVNLDELSSVIYMAPPLRHSPGQVKLRLIIRFRADLH
ncbi:MAG: hypothetical protein LBN33_00245 [Desulfovibrio sp.]|nr:hypothetical protein [Desulfovibrio sp.]